MRSSHFEKSIVFYYNVISLETMRYIFYFSFVCFFLVHSTVLFAQDHVSDSSALMAEDSSMLHTYIDRASLRMDGKYFKGAIADYSQALAIYSTDPHLWFQRGLAYEKIKSYKNAREDYNTALALDSTQLDVILARARVNGELYLTNDAISDYTKAIKSNPDNGMLYFLRGQQYVYKKQFDRACQDFNSALAKNYQINRRHIKNACK
jgi:tetratricopeptide (TPR) repeat protein